MAGIRNIISFTLLILITSAGIVEDNRSLIYSAYVNNRMDQWKKVIDRMEAADHKDNGMVLELINYQYGYIGYCLGNGKEKEAQSYLAAAERNVTILEKSGYKIPVLNAYKAAFYGYRIAMNKLSVMINGQRSLNHARKSVELDSTNYLGFIQLGNAYFYMPGTFGGSKRMAFDFFSRARKIMEKETGLRVNNWNYLSLLVTIAQSHTYLGEYELAKAEYENILKIEPGFLYVRNVLFPGLLEKMKTAKKN